MTVISQDMVLSQSFVMNKNTDDLLQGAEGRKYILSALSNAVNPVVNVPYSDFSDYSKSAVIENLIIDGQNKGVTGILLQNVVKCQIRNVTIKNCDVGIHLRSYFGMWSECNFLKHIRMENVTKGIVFTTTGPYNDPATGAGGPGDSAAFTTIDDVGISLANRSDAVGIQIGGTQITNDPNNRPDVTTTTIKPYSSRIKANVWVGSNGGTGLKVINGELKHALTHLTVTGPSSGIGVDLQGVINGNSNNPDRVVWYNQFSKFDMSDNVTKRGFMLVTSGIGTPINPSSALTDISTKTF
jgi:hypothetical protein